MIAMTAKTMSKPKLKYFSPMEFGIWYPLMSVDLLLKLDEFREQWGAPVMVSPVAGGIGREGAGDTSQHNVTAWGEVRAIDVFPKVIGENGETRFIETEAERNRAYEVAQAVGFTGIGLYTDTQPGDMLHIDVRPDRQAGRPATWARVDGEYLGIDTVLV